MNQAGQAHLRPDNFSLGIFYDFGLLCCFFNIKQGCSLGVHKLFAHSILLPDGCGDAFYQMVIYGNALFAPFIEKQNIVIGEYGEHVIGVVFTYNVIGRVNYPLPLQVKVAELVVLLGFDQPVGENCVNIFKLRFDCPFSVT